MSKNFDISNRLFILSCIFVLIVATFVAFVSMKIFGFNDGYYNSELSVEGTGVVYAYPDTAEVSLGVDLKAVDTEGAIAKNKEVTESIISALKELEIEAKDINTEYYWVGENYKWTEDRGDYIDGYRVDHTIVVKTTQIELVDEIIEKASQSGATSINNVYFSIENMEKYEDQARIEAINKAKAKAESISETSGIDLGDILSYYEYSDDYYYDGYYGKGMDNGYYDYSYAELALEESVEVDVSAISSVEPVEIQEKSILAGEQKVTMNVSMTYEID